MKIIIGLGNPGNRFKKTRHNLGKMVIDEWQSATGFPDFKLNKKLKALLSESKFDKEKVILAMPQASMNLSGTTIKSLLRYYKVPVKNILVVHDDIDLPLGKIKVSKEQGSAGHKGVQSIINQLKTKSFIRIRIGILPKRGKPKKTESFVLKKFNKNEEKMIVETVVKATKILKMILKKGLEKTKQELGV